MVLWASFYGYYFQHVVYYAYKISVNFLGSTGSMSINNIYTKIVRSPSVTEILLPALSVLFGLQVLRVLIPQMAWLLGDRFGLNSIMLGIIALVIFSFSFLSGVLNRLAGSRNTVIYTASGLGIIRLLVQVQWPEPLVSMCLAVIGTIFFGIFLAAYLDNVRLRGGSTGNFTAGLLSGLILDTALNGAFGTYDLAWNSGLAALLIIIFLVPVQWQIITAWKAAYTQDNGATDTGGNTWQWLAIGPFLFLQMVILQNIPRWAVITGWQTPYAYGWLLLAQIAGLFVAVWFLREERRRLWLVSLIAGIILVAFTAFPYPGQSWLAAIAVFVEQVSVSILIAIVILGTRDSETRFRSVTAPNGVGILLLGILTLGYYTAYQISLPYTNTVLEPIAAAIVVICALIPCLRMKKPAFSAAIPWITPALALLLLILPLVGIISWQEPEPAEGNGFPLKLMTYNLHNGFNTDGDLDMEAFALVIEENNPDIIVLQEISRGWLVSGRMDMLTWLSQRLDMLYVSGPTAGPLWGNAILSRYPIVKQASYELPPRDLPILRGFLMAEIDIGNGENLNVIATHLHHVGEDSAIRQEQVPVIIDTWNGMARTVIAGDLNAEPDSPEIGMLRDAGLVDVIAAAGISTGFTYNSADPYQRIDYIWISPDLESRNADVFLSQASDHLPVVTEIYR